MLGFRAAAASLQTNRSKAPATVAAIDAFSCGKNLIGIFQMLARSTEVMKPKIQWLFRCGGTHLSFLIFCRLSFAFFAVSLLRDAFGLRISC